MSWKLCLVCLLYLPFQMIPSKMLYTSQHITHMKKRAYEKKNPWPYIETFDNIEMVKHFSTERKEAKRFAEIYTAKL